MITKEEFGTKNGEIATLVTPFANKDYCFNRYLEGIKHLPLSKMSGLFYDNCSDKDFSSRIKSFGKARFKHFIYMRDDSPHTTADSTTDYASVSKKVFSVYRSIEDNLPDNDLTIIVEDDTEVPENTFNKLKAVLDNQTKVATAVGSVCSRRLKDSTHGYPIAWQFNVEHKFSIPRSSRNDVMVVKDRRLADPRSFGIELIGASHMACWLTRTKVIREVGFQTKEDNLPACDMNWGFHINQMGHWMAIDWSVICKHLWKREGEIGFNSVETLMERFPQVMAFKGPYLHQDQKW